MCSFYLIASDQTKIVWISFFLFYLFIAFLLSVSTCFPISFTPVGLTWAGLCSPKMATIRASGAVTPLPGDTGLRGLMVGDGTVSGETKRSFLEEQHGERLRDWLSLERGHKFRPCNAGRGLEESAGTAGLRLWRWRWCRLPVLGLGLREFGASRTMVLSSSELTLELSEQHTVGLRTGILICWGLRKKVIVVILVY